MAAPSSAAFLRCSSRMSSTAFSPVCTFSACRRSRSASFGSTSEALRSRPEPDVESQRSFSGTGRNCARWEAEGEAPSCGGEARPMAPRSMKPRGSSPAASATLGAAAGAALGSGGAGGSASASAIGESAALGEAAVGKPAAASFGESAAAGAETVGESAAASFGESAAAGAETVGESAAASFGESAASGAAAVGASAASLKLVACELLAVDRFALPLPLPLAGIAMDPRAAGPPLAAHWSCILRRSAIAPDSFFLAGSGCASTRTCLSRCRVRSCNRTRAPPAAPSPPPSPASGPVTKRDTTTPTNGSYFTPGCAGAPLAVTPAAAAAATEASGKGEFMEAEETEGAKSSSAPPPAPTAASASANAAASTASCAAAAASAFCPAASVSAAHNSSV
ncbi:hypothetical protein T492DRAFT_961875 [Pavlovales sp. CCMP2436]|nr:hypothetical protein T492DRAFT_961875 [Pavlovales sp. CCMP2436]